MSQVSDPPGRDLERVALLEPAPPPLAISLLGPFSLEVSGVPLPRLRSRKQEAILALLALRHDRPVERAWLAGLLWPDSAPSQGLATLRRYLTTLRQLLGPEASRLRSPTASSLMLDLAGTRVDLIAFERAMARGDPGSLEEAVALYRGALLEGWTEEWVFQERQPREQAYLESLERLAAAARASGDLPTAERHLRRAVAVDPLRESAQRALMEALAASGNYAGVIQSYRELRLRLHGDLNAEPDAETQHLFQRLREEARSRADAPVAVGRREAGARSDTSSQPAAPTASSPRPRAPAPDSTVTFLFTDVEGSTRLWEQHPEPMRRALAHHDDLLREAIESHGGEVFKTFGDQFCAVFSAAPAALAAAIAAQRALQAEPWEEIGPLRVRMALHTGVAHQREDDYFGSTLNRVARLLEVGHGGQVLLSRATQELVRDDLAEGADLLDLGEHQLKDLTRPERIYQVVHPDLPSQFPPLVSLNRRLHNLPHPPSVGTRPTALLGRERQVAELVERLQREEIRLLTLTGPGGIGKSRLQLQVAAELLDRYPDGVWRADLAPLTDPSLVLPTVASALGLQEEPGRPLLPLLTDWLRQRSLLLVLDRCEHLTEACSELASTLLRAGPGLRILASSRQALGLAGEVHCRVPALETPDPRTLAPARAGAAAAIAHSPAVELFVERAAAIQRSFALTDQNALAVAQICHRLDGIPWMIELAAARVEVLSVEQIVARMDDFFRLLTGSSRAALRASIESSDALLSEPERVLMRRLSVFVGGWGLEAAEAIGAGDRVAQGDVVDLLTLLVEKSLVLSEDPGTVVRYRLPEAVRQYGRERLLESGEAAAVQDRHQDYFLKLVERFEIETYGCNGPGWLDRLEAHLDNVRAALDWLVLRQEMPTGLGWTPVLAQFWRLRGPASEGLQRLKQILALPCAQEPSAARAHTLIRMGDLARQQADYALASALYEEGLALYRALGEQGRVMACYALLAIVARDSGDYPRARSLYEEMVVAVQVTGKGRGSWLSSSLCGRGYVAYLQGDLDTAQALLEESLSIYREQGHGHASHVGWILAHLAEVADGRGDYQTAERLFTETLHLWHESSHQQEQESFAFVLRRLGRVRQHQGDAGAARAHFTEALALLQGHGEPRGIAECLEGLAGVAAAQGRPVHATHLIGAAELLRERIGAPLPPVERGEHDRRLAAARAQLDEEAFAAAWSRGRSISLRQAIAEALEEAPAG
jgi:predicted ATPase/class 3 adenylate cyclase